MRGVLPRAGPIDSTVLSSKARNFSRISSHASGDNFRKRTLPAISSASHPFCSSRRSYRCSRIDDPICRYHIVRSFDFLGNNKQSTESIIRFLQLVELFGFRIIVLYTHERDSSATVHFDQRDSFLSKLPAFLYPQFPAANRRLFCRDRNAYASRHGGESGGTGSIQLSETKLFNARGGGGGGSVVGGDGGRSRRHVCSTRLVTAADRYCA